MLATVATPSPPAPPPPPPFNHTLGWPVNCLRAAPPSTLQYPSAVPAPHTPFSAPCPAPLPCQHFIHAWSWSCRAPPYRPCHESPAPAPASRPQAFPSRLAQHPSQRGLLALPCAIHIPPAHRQGTAQALYGVCVYHETSPVHIMGVGKAKQAGVWHIPGGRKLSSTSEGSPFPRDLTRAVPLQWGGSALLMKCATLWGITLLPHT